jgi:hypothetical protein
MSRGLVICLLSIWALAFVACRRPSDEDLGLARPPERKVALDELTEPPALLAAIGQSGASLDERLGARGFDVARTIEVTVGAGGDRIDDALHFDSDGKGGFSLVHDLDHPQAVALTPPRGEGDATRDKVDPRAQGMAAIALPGRLFVRARFGRFVERRPEPGELDRLRELGEQLFVDDLALLAPWLQITDQGEGSVEGRHARRLSLGKRSSRASAPKDGDPRRAWRETVEASEVHGELSIDANTGALLAGQLDARFSFLRGDDRVPAHIVTVQTARQPSLFVAPPDALVNPHRPRPTVERNQLLEGLAPMAGTQAARATP